MTQTTNVPVKFYEVHLSFKTRSQAVVPVTAKTEDEAKEIAAYLFRDYEDLKIEKLRDVAEEKETEEEATSIEAPVLH